MSNYIIKSCPVHVSSNTLSLYRRLLVLSICIFDSRGQLWSIDICFELEHGCYIRRIHTITKDYPFCVHSPHVTIFTGTKREKWFSTVVSVHCAIFTIKQYSRLHKLSDTVNGERVHV